MAFPVLLFVPLGLILSALGYPMMKRKVPPNRLYGLRVPATLRNERVWYDANAVAGRDLMVVGGIVATTSAVLGISGLAPELQAGISGAVLGVLAMAATLRGVLLANRLEKVEASRRA
ncbi:MAG TPA: SdpI family protein [Polyangiaceae bacterium]|nr:SdpI family protein [Polyangiaceae bacterium]